MMNAKSEMTSMEMPKSGSSAKAPANEMGTPSDDPERDPRAHEDGEHQQHEQEARPAVSQHGVAPVAQIAGAIAPDGEVHALGHPCAGRGDVRP